MRLLACCPLIRVRTIQLAQLARSQKSKCGSRFLGDLRRKGVLYLFVYFDIKAGLYNTIFVMKVDEYEWMDV